MKEVIEKLRLELRKLVDLKLQVEACLSIAPEGTLEISTIKEKTRFYKVTDNEKKYLSFSSKEIIPLGNKRYHLQVLRNTKKRIKALENCLKDLTAFVDTKTTFLIYNEQPDKIKPYITPLKDTNEDYAKKWQSKKYRGLGTTDYSFRTLRGEFVKSKTELIIADRLYLSGIPYHYEVPLSIDPITTFYPDFYVLNKRTRKVYYWEHFGRMDDPLYCEKALRKIETYAFCGYTLGENLIATFESSKYSICTKHLDLLIKTYFT